MALSTQNIRVLKNLEPHSILGDIILQFEFMKYETENFREKNVIDKNEICDHFLNILQKKGSNENNSNLTKDHLRKDLEKFFAELDKMALLHNNDNIISDIKWDKITEVCDLLRRIEKSNERKVRWALFYFFNKGHTKISIKNFTDYLAEFNIKNLEKSIKKILKVEYDSGLDANYDGSDIIINHQKEDKLVSHYLLDALEESRRRPGELEEEILTFLDEGSYSNQEISKILSVDEAMVSRTIGKLRSKNKIILSSFGSRGSRYYTTNCENCPFGKTIASCRKDSLSYIINTFKNFYGIDLSSNDFEEIETNQALLQMKRIFMMVNKDSNTKLERNLHENLRLFLSRIINESLKQKGFGNVTKISKLEEGLHSVSKNLPILYQMGLQKGSETIIEHLSRSDKTKNSKKNKMGSNDSDSKDDTSINVSKILV